MSEHILRQSLHRAGLALDRAKLSLSPSPRALDPDRALAELPETPRILFLCHGNICRSPMAERYARKCDEPGVARFDSAGLLDVDGRTSPPTAVDAGMQYGVDLTTHRSTGLSETMLEAADLVFVMDVRNYRRLHRKFSGVTDDVYFLSAFARSDDVAIDDPHGEGWRAFNTAYERVTKAVDRLVATLVERRECTTPPSEKDRNVT